MELLVKAIDASNPVYDAGCYKAGMIVLAKPDGHEWGRLEGPPTFAIIRLPGVPVEAVEKFLEPETDPLVPEVPVRRRQYAIDIPALPKSVRTRLGTNGITVKPDASYKGASDISWDNLKGNIVRLGTGERETRSLAELAADRRAASPR